MATIGNLVVNLSAKTQKFTGGLARAEKASAKFVRGLIRVTKAVVAFGVAAATAAAVGLTALINRSFDTIDTLAKVSRKLGIATEDMAGLRLAAEETGAGTRTLDMGLQRMVRRISEAAIGIGEARGAIKEIGLDAVALGRLTPDQQFIQIAEAMSKVTNQSDRVRLSFKLFDSEGVALVNTLALGRKGLEETREAAEKLGLAVSMVDAERIEKANDAWGRMKSAVTGIGNQLAIVVAPSMEAFAKWITDSATTGNGLSRIMDGISTIMLGLRESITLVQLAFLKVEEVFFNLVAGIASGIQKVLDMVIELGNAVAEWFDIQKIQRTTFAGNISESATARAGAARSKAATLISEQMARALKRAQEGSKPAAAAAPVTTGGGIGGGTISEFAKKAGEFLGRGSAPIFGGVMEQINKAVRSGTGVFAGPQAQGPRAANLALEAASAEGFQALRANLGEKPADTQKKIKQLAKEAKKDDKKRNSLLELSKDALVSLVDKLDVGSILT